MNTKLNLMRYCVTKFYFVHLALGRSPFSILDIGLVNNSVQNTKDVFGDNLRVYDGIDIIEHSNLEIRNFYKIDLNKNNLDVIPDNTYECVICNHVLEHLDDPIGVSRELIKKVKPGGCIFFEFPSEKSLQRTSLLGLDTYHFNDDLTHKHIVSTLDVCNLLLECQFKIISSGTKFPIFRRIASYAKFFVFCLQIRNPLKAIPHLSGRIHHIIATRPGAPALCKVHISENGT